MGWVSRVTPWFAVVVLALVAVWLAFAVYEWAGFLMGAEGRTNTVVGGLLIYAAALAGTLCMMLVGVRAAAAPRRWPSDRAVRVLATLGLVLIGMSAPLMVLRGDYGIGGVVIGVTPLLVYYVRIRRALIDILPAWCGGAWRPATRRPRRPGEEKIKRPPRAWDETSGPRADHGGSTTAGSRRKRGKKKRRSGR